jgi:hypothetical protein
MTLGFKSEVSTFISLRVRSRNFVHDVRKLLHCRNVKDKKKILLNLF